MPPSGQPSESPRLKNSKDGKGNATPKANDSAGILKPSSPPGKSRTVSPSKTEAKKQPSPRKPSPKTRKPSPKPSPAQAGPGGHEKPSPRKPSPKTPSRKASPKRSPAQAGIRGSNHVESGNRDKHVSLPMSSIVLYTIAYDI